MNHVSVEQLYRMIFSIRLASFYQGQHLQALRVSCSPAWVPSDAGIPGPVTQRRGSSTRPELRSNIPGRDQTKKLAAS